MVGSLVLSKRAFEVADSSHVVRSSNTASSYSDDAIKVCIRPPEKAEHEAADEKMWGMFVQAIVGQRVTDDSGREVMKLALVSFPLPPGLEDRGADIIRSALGRPDEEVVQFNSEGTLLAHLSSSQAPISYSSLGVFSDLYNAAGTVVAANHPNQRGANVEHFRKFQVSRNLRLGVLQNDVMSILYRPEHQNSSAWDLNFGGAFRQEMLFDGERIMAPNPNNEIVELTPMLANKDHDYGHSDWLRWLIASVTAAYKGGAKSIVGFHVDSTVTVSSCGGSKGCSDFYEKTMVIPYYGAINANGTFANYGGENAAFNPYVSKAAPDVSSGQSQSGSDTTNNACSNCGKSGGQCSCGMHQRQNKDMTVQAGQGHK